MPPIARPRGRARESTGAPTCRCGRAVSPQPVLGAQRASALVGETRALALDDAMLLLRPMWVVGEPRLGHAARQGTARTMGHGKSTGSRAPAPACSVETPDRRAHALYAYWRGAGAPSEETLVESGQDAWYWGAPLPGGEVNAAVFVDPSTPRDYERLIARSTLLAPRLRGAQRVSGVHACDATPHCVSTRYLSRACRPPSARRCTRPWSSIRSWTARMTPRSLSSSIAPASGTRRSFTPRRRRSSIAGKPPRSAVVSGSNGQPTWSLCSARRSRHRASRVARRSFAPPAVRTRGRRRGRLHRPDRRRAGQRQ